MHKTMSFTSPAHDSDLIQRAKNNVYTIIPKFSELGITLSGEVFR